MIGIVLLVAVLIPGLGALRDGSRAWFVFGPLSLQPVGGRQGGADAVGGARAGAAPQRAAPVEARAARRSCPSPLLIFVLLILQPDLGMTVSMGIVLVALLFFAGAPLRLMAAADASAAWPVR